MLLRLATRDDIPALMALVRSVVPLMRAQGNLQWDHEYPNAEVFADDIATGQLWIADLNGTVAGVAAITTEQSPEYADVGWDLNEPAIVVHRLAVDPDFRGGGIAAALMHQAELIAHQRGITALRVDTNTQNPATQRLLPKLGYTLAGEIGLSYRAGPAFPLLREATQAASTVKDLATAARALGQCSTWNISARRIMDGMSKPRIAIPIPTSFDPAYNERSWPQYAKAVERSGGEPVPVPLDDAAKAAELARSCDAVLLPGSGADIDSGKFGQERDPNSANPDPAREQVDSLLLETAEQQAKPVLAICFGTQMLNVWRGGSLIQHLPEAPVNHRQRGVVEAHQADVTPDSLLASAAGLNGAEPGRVFHVEHSTNGTRRIAVNSSHHQALGQPGKGLRVVATSPDDGVIEAVEDSNGHQFLLGVQWHPERTYDESPQSKAIFDRFVSEAARQKPHS